MEDEVYELSSLSVDARKMIIDMCASAVGCHIGGSLSAVDLLLASYKYYGNNEHNKVILSKGHAAAALYSVLYLYGVITDNPCDSYGRPDSIFTGHPNDAIAGISFSTGSLGHGLAYGAGWALAQSLSNTGGLSVVISGDGELQEGSCWETLQVISAKHINNIVYIIDRNNAQNDGLLDDISPYFDLQGRFNSYGLDVVTINGHNFREILQAFMDKRKDRTLVIIANTVKGKGIKSLENNPSCHYAKIKKAQAIRWKDQLNGML